MRRAFVTTVLLVAGIFLLPGCVGLSDQPTDISGRASEGFSDPKALALAEAAERGNVRTMERLVKEGADVNYAGRLGITPAWWAIRNRNKQGFAWLLAHGANPNPVVQTITIMEMAAGYADSEFLEIALPYKPNLNRVNYATYKSPIDTAIEGRRQRNLELLIKAGADLNQKDQNSPAAMAMALAFYDFALLMLQAGADTSRVIPAGPNKGQNELAWMISNRIINPDTDAYEWRERVIRFLKTKGITAERPPLSEEPARTKPLPPDLAEPAAK